MNGHPLPARRPGLFAGDAALAWIAWTRVQGGAFPATLAEFRKDQQWLTLLAKKT